MIELIPLKELDSGFNRAKFLVESYFETSKLAFEKSHYHISIGLSILAYEEISKMQAFFMAKSKGKGISKEDWILITKGDKKQRKSAHVVKPTKSYIDRKNFIKERGFNEHLVTEQILNKMDSSWMYQTFEEKTRIDPLALKRTQTFGDIKNACFYLDWKDDSWQIFTKVSKPKRKALADLLLWIVEFHYCTTTLDFENPTITNDENSPSFKKYINDPRFKRQQELTQRLKNKEFLKVRTLGTHVIDEYGKRNVPTKNRIKNNNLQ